MKLSNSFFRKRSMWGLGLAACAFLFSAADGVAQHYVHGTTATLNNNATGTIRMRNAASQFRNFAPATTNIVNAGVFDVVGNVSGNVFTDGAGSGAGATALGTTAPMRVPGLVRYSNGGAAQTVQGRWYTSLEMSAASQKDFLTSTVYVSNAYTVGGGNREYGTGTFVYDGSGAQTITGENGTSGNTNRYYNLFLQNGGTKTVAAATEVRVSQEFREEASNTATVTINGTLRSENITAQQAGAGAIAVDGAAASFNLGSGTASFASTTNVNLENGGTLNTSTGAANFAGASNVNNGLFNVTSTGLVTIDATGTLTLANAGNAMIMVTSGSQVDVTGTFANNFAARTNMHFNDASLVRYNGSAAQTIVSTVLTNPYGSLTVTSGTKTAGGNIHISEDFAAYDNNLPMGANTLFMSDAANGTVTYGSGIEVVGRMNRTMANGTPLTFNNENTIVTMTGGTAPDNMTFNVQPATAPNQFVATTDVNRKITVDYSAGGWTANIRAGYKTSDIPGAWAGAGTTENDVRFYEADASLAEKMGTGSPYSRVTTGTVHYVELAGFQATAATVDGLADRYFASTNDLLLRSGPTTFYTINHGRWSNPGTWDEGIEPGANDNAVVNHTVHVGYRRNGIDGLDADGQRMEGQFAGTKSALIRNVTIGDVADASLLFGSNSGGAGDEATQNVNWLITGTSGLINNRGGATLDANSALLTGTLTSGTLYNGLINFPTPGTSSIRVEQNLSNNGALSNGGLIEVGQ